MSQSTALAFGAAEPQPDVPHSSRLSILDSGVVRCPEVSMPRITTVGPEARARLVRAGAGKGYQDRQPYRDAIAGLTADAMIELEPEGGETMRQVKARLQRAAKEVGREIRSGETQQGTLLVWLAEPTRRRPRRRSGATGLGMAGLQSEAPLGEAPP